MCTSSFVAMISGHCYWCQPLRLTSLDFGGGVTFYPGGKDPTWSLLARSSSTARWQVDTVEVRSQQTLGSFAYCLASKWKPLKLRSEKLLSPGSLMWRFYRNDFCLFRALFEVLLSWLIFSETSESDKIEFGGFGKRHSSSKKGFYLKTILFHVLRDDDSKYKNMKLANT